MAICIIFIFRIYNNAKETFSEDENANNNYKKIIPKCNDNINDNSLQLVSIANIIMIIWSINNGYNITAKEGLMLSHNSLKATTIRREIKMKNRITIDGDDVTDDYHDEAWWVNSPRTSTRLPML